MLVQARKKRCFGSAFFVWHTLLLHTVLQVFVYVPYNAPTVQSVANAALATVDAHTHALTVALPQAACDETLQQLHSTCALCIIYIYVALGNGDAAVSKQVQPAHAHPHLCWQAG